MRPLYQRRLYRRNMQHAKIRILLDSYEVFLKYAKIEQTKEIKVQRAECWHDWTHFLAQSQ